LGSPGYPGPDGRKGAFLRLAGVSEFDKDYQNIKGGGCFDVFALDQDPLDPGEEPIGHIPFTFVFRRINVD
jgi:hypothetical protein